jgi:hypothetical protein
VSFLNNSGFVISISNFNENKILLYLLGCIITNLNKYKRKLIHTEADKLNLFHWSVYVNDKDANLIISNNEKDRESYEAKKRKYYKTNKSDENRSEQIKNLLDSTSISNARKLKLQVEQAAMENNKPDPETVDYIRGILNPSPSAAATQPPKKRGRPPKKDKDTVNPDQISEIAEPTRRYNTRSSGKK